MKKILVGVVTIIGIALAAVGIGLKMNDAASIAVIGAADGPTTIFVAGRLGSGISYGFIFVGVVLSIIGIMIYIKNKK